MEKIIGNFLNPGNGATDFPLDCETLDALQTLTAMAQVVGNIAGDKVVLYGCRAYESRGVEYRDSGYVFVRTDEFPEGEVLRWEGGPTGGGMYVKQEAVNIRANDMNYSHAYTRRWLAAGSGNGQPFYWSEFTDIEAIQSRSLRARIDAVGLGSPVGVVQMWAGKEVPPGYLLCDGGDYSQQEYPELYAVIGTTFNESWVGTGYAPALAAGHFRVPDLRGRFIVGWKAGDSDYGEVGDVGGSAKVDLVSREVAGATSETPRTNIMVAADAAGSENRPPYYVLAYIIRAK